MDVSRQPRESAVTETPELSPRSLIAQWREMAKSLRAPDDGTKSWHNEQGHADGLEEAADQLEQALTPLADLEAEMRRFAEKVPHSMLWNHEVEAQVLAWAERLKALQG